MLALALGAALAAHPQPAAVVPVGAGPCGAAAAAGRVWVASDADGTLAAIDPRRNRVVRTIHVGASACAVRSGLGSLWVTQLARDAVLRVDPRTGAVTSIPVADGPVDVEAGAGAVWVSSFAAGTVSRLDPRTNRVVSSVAAGTKPGALALAGGSLWIGQGGESRSLLRLDPATGRVSSVSVAHRAPQPIAVVRGALWANTADDRVVRVDLRSGRVTATVRVHGVPAQAALAPDGLLWVAAKQANTVTRIDPVRARVVDVTPAGAGAYDVVRAFGAMWVTSYAGADVWRWRTAS